MEKYSKQKRPKPKEKKVIDEWFRDLELNIIAERGISPKLNGFKWIYTEEEIDQSWKPAIRVTLNLYVRWFPGSFIEEKQHTLAWHYSNVEPGTEFKGSQELLDILYHLVHNTLLQVIDGDHVIEIKSSAKKRGNR